MSTIKEALRKFGGKVSERFLKILEILLYFAMDGFLACAVGYGILRINSFLTKAVLEFGAIPTYSEALLYVIEAPIAYHVLLFVWRDLMKCLKEGKVDDNLN
ncbi:MAG: hypothetical protein ACRESZ_04845 [Methylococcales bacterium]